MITYTWTVGRWRFDYRRYYWQVIEHYPGFVVTGPSIHREGDQLHYTLSHATAHLARRMAGYITENPVCLGDHVAAGCEGIPSTVRMALPSSARAVVEVPWSWAVLYRPALWCAAHAEAKGEDWAAPLFRALACVTWLAERGETDEIRAVANAALTTPRPDLWILRDLLTDAGQGAGRLDPLFQLPTLRGGPK